MTDAEKFARYANKSIKRYRETVKEKETKKTNEVNQNIENLKNDFSSGNIDAKDYLNNLYSNFKKLTNKPDEMMKNYLSDEENHKLFEFSSPDNLIDIKDSNIIKKSWVPETGLPQLFKPITSGLNDADKTDIDRYFESISTKGMTPDELKIYKTNYEQAKGLEGITKSQTAKRDQAVKSLEDYLTGKNNQSFSDLDTALQKGSDVAFSREQPLLLEDLNARGLLQSSALGEALAREKSLLEKEREAKLGEAKIGMDTNTTNLIAQAKMAGSEADVNSLRDIYNQSNQYTNSALQRNFSLDDWNREAELSKTLAAYGQPNVVNQSPNPFMGALSGAGTGAIIGSVIPGIGTAAGAIGGGAIGFLGSSKSGGK